MVEFTWIASFPKSGSTWMRYIVSHVLFGEDIDKSLVREMVPNIHDWEGPLKYDWRGSHPAKTHLKYDNLPDRMKSRAAICMVRNPLDIVDSSVAYMSPESQESSAKIVDEFIKTGTIEPWGQMLGYGAWDENVESWMEQQDRMPVLLQRYEDLLQDPHTGVRQVAEFLECDLTEEKIDRIVSATSFSTMKAREKEEVTEGRAGVFTDERLFDKKEFSFMRSGVTGGYQESFSKSQIDGLIERFHPMMKRMGYID